MRVSVHDVVHIQPTTALSDKSGLLTVCEADKHLPPSFVIKRTFWVSGVEPGTCRGHHAHRRCSQALVALHGIVDVTVSDGRESSAFRLQRVDQVLLIPPLIWSTQTYVTSGAVLFVFCDAIYQEEEYIREYDEYIILREDG